MVIDRLGLDVAFLGLVIAFGGVWVKRRIALIRGIMDVPNARSSHEVPTPRGGGLAVVLAMSICLALMAARGDVSGDLALALIVPGAMVASIGYLDDLRGVSARSRLFVQSIAAVAAMSILGGWAPSWAQFGSLEWALLQTAAVVALVGSTNLFNFMDGIDGIAGAEAAFLGFGGAWLVSLVATEPSVVNVSILLCATSLGFLAWNWPPAKIFMGDVGSGYLGLVIGILAIASAKERTSLIFIWVILGTAFLVDSSLTLLRRLTRGERVYEAHRTHAYQWLARGIGSHRPVTLLYLSVNVLWLLPMAWLCACHLQYAFWIMLGALAPVIVGAFVAGAGRSDHPP